MSSQKPLFFPPSRFNTRDKTGCSPRCRVGHHKGTKNGCSGRYNLRIQNPHSKYRWAKCKCDCHD